MSLPLILTMMRTKRIVMTTTETMFAKMNMATVCAFMEHASSFPEAPNEVPVNKSGLLFLSMGRGLASQGV
jgi:hypothetical protein